MASIVYLDDEPHLTEIFSSLFKGTYHEFKVFNDEFEAIEYCLENPPDILFVDYRLKSMHGDEVAKQLSNHIHKVLVTGDIKIDSKYKFDSVISKPFKLVQLIDKVQEFTEN